MSDAVKRTTTKTWNEYVLRLPTNATEVSKAIQWAVRDIGEGTYWDDSIEVISEDDEWLILRVETTDE